MKEARKIVRWLRIAYVLQTVVLFLVWIISTTKLSAVANNLLDSLYRSGLTVEQGDKVSQAFFSISNAVSWYCLAGMILTNVAFILLTGNIKKNWPNPNEGDREGI